MTVQVVSEGPQGRVFVDPISGGLSITTLTFRDSGVYTCVARSNAGVSETSALVSVLPLHS